MKITRRNLPHWEIEGSVYFVTFSTKKMILNIEEQLIVKEHIIAGNPAYYLLFALIVMPDHVHLLFQPNKGFTLSRIMKGIKGVSARKINENRGIKGQVWQDESFDRIVRDEAEFNEKLSYMLNNPVKGLLTDDAWNYAGWYFNENYE